MLAGFAALGRFQFAHFSILLNHAAQHQLHCIANLE